MRKLKLTLTRLRGVRISEMLYDGRENAHEFLLEWAHRHALPSGIMAEQVNPFTSEPLSVSPLTWSHAEYILTVYSYLRAYDEIQKRQE